MKFFTPQKNKGFTIIETLVAIAILMISIAGPLTIAQKGLLAATYAKDQVTASFYAQNLMESIKNQRSTNLLNGVQWRANLPCTPTSSGKFNASCSSNNLGDDEMTVTVRVTWQSGTISNSVVLVSELFNVIL